MRVSEQTIFDIQTVVLGAGFMGGVHTEALKRLGVGVAGIMDISPEAAQRVAQSQGVTKVYRSIPEVLKDPQVDVVHITTPNASHFEIAAQALRAGKHVMCEKPLAMNTRESAELVRIAADTGRVAGVNYNIRFYPLCHEARHRIQQGEIGDVFSIYGSYVQDWLLYDTDYNWRVLNEEGGALRAVADIGTHWLDLMSFITGDIVDAVCADLHTVHKTRKRPRGEVETFAGKVDRVIPTEAIPIATEDMGSILLRFCSGARGHLWVSQVTAGRKNCLRYEIAGSKQSLAWNSEQPNELWLGTRQGPNRTLVRDPGLLSEAARAVANYPGGHNEGFPDTFKQCFKGFYEYIVAGDYTAPEPFPTFREGHHEVALCEAIEKSAREEAWVKIGHA
jgi:predicted dehydrogenase